jgi:hypothetical protein
VKSRTDIFLGKPQGLWFPKRSKTFRFGLTGIHGMPKVIPHERATVPTVGASAAEEQETPPDAERLRDPF